MRVPVTGFVGSFSVTDVTSGLSGGSTPVAGFSGSVPTSNLRGHVYAGSLTGTAFFLATPISSTVPNDTTFTNRSMRLHIACYDLPIEKGLAA